MKLPDILGKRSCFYGFRDALTFNNEGEMVPACQGKSEVPFDEWTGEELCWMMSGCMKEAKMGRASNMPKIILRTMEKCGVEKGQELNVMRGILKEIDHLRKGSGW